LFFNFSLIKNCLISPLFQCQYQPDHCPSLLEGKMFALFASLFECSFLLFAAVSALVSIVQPKMKSGLLLLALPLLALIPAVTGAAGDNQQNAAVGSEDAAVDGTN
jgi:hypothetical protein